jgi:hypothetical protein
MLSNPIFLEILIKEHPKDALMTMFLLKRKRMVKKTID